MRISDWSSDVCSSDLSLLYIIKGAEEVNSGKAGPEALAAEAIDDKTLKVELTSAAPYFLAQLSHQTAFPVPKHVVEKFDRDWTKPENIVVNGAYKLTEWVPKVQATLDKNAKFYDADNEIGKAPCREKVYK